MARGTSDAVGNPRHGKPTRNGRIDPVPRIALTPDEAAASLGVSRDYFGLIG